MRRPGGTGGDSLAEGTRPYIPHELPHWRVRQSAKVGRHASAGAAVMRRYGDAHCHA
jgi:hypothetical protein